MDSLFSFQCVRGVVEPTEREQAIPIPFLYWSFISAPQNDLIRRAQTSLGLGMASDGQFGHRRRRNGVTGYNFVECCKSALPKEREGEAERDGLLDKGKGNQSTFPPSLPPSVTSFLPSFPA